MKRSLSSVALLLSALAAVPAPAQVCGPLTFAFSTTGPGCDPSGIVVPPTLSATQFLSPGSSACEIRFLLNANVFSGPTVPPPPLVLGVSNPAVPVLPYPGCTLWTSLDVFLSMNRFAPSPNLFDVVVPVAPDPALIGGTVFAQAALPLGGAPRLSNGIRVDIL